MRFFDRKVVSMLLICSIPMSGGSALAQIAPTDKDIGATLQKELQHSELVAYGNLRLTVEDGIASFEGSVPSIASARQIEDIASTVRGVRAIVNRLAVEPPARSAGELRDDIVAAFGDNPATDLYQLDIMADDNGRVTLSGLVDSWTEYDLAETVAGSVAGVRSVENQIKVDTTQRYRGAGEIEGDISERLRWDARVDDSLITVLVRDGGRVMLSGTVGSLAEKRLATSLAYVVGVRSVDSKNLDVESWARDESRRLGAAPDVADTDIRAAIERAVALDSRVMANGIEVTVVNGEVTLSGSVGSIAASRAAERTAQNTRGTQSVHNALSVERLMLDDAEIRDRVHKALAGFDNLQLDVRVDDGRVQILGNVDNVEQYRLIDEIAANIRGMDRLENNLTVRGEVPVLAANPFMATSRVLMPRDRSETQIPTDRALHESVASELFWSPFVDEDQVDIAVSDGTVTLTGMVASISASRAAVDNAYEAGALIVNNQLELEYR